MPYKTKKLFKNHVNNILKDHVTIQEETDLVKELEDKYGIGSIDLQAGEFIPAPEPPAEAAEAPEVVEE